MVFYFGIVNFIVGSIGLIAFPSLANKFSRKVVYILSAVLLVLGLLGMFLLVMTTKQVLFYFQCS